MREGSRSIMRHKLRPYQSESLDNLRQAIRQGSKAIMLQLPTAGGKTTIAAEVMKGAVAKGNRAWFIVDSVELVDQSWKRFEAEGLSTGVIMGKDERTDYSKPAQVATIQTLRNRWDQVAEKLRPTVIVVDECFVAGTRVTVPGGTKPIEEIRPGDLVANATGWGEVISTTAKPSSELIRLEMSDGNVITCTPNHPFFTSSGWVNAEALAVGSRLYRQQDVRSLWAGVHPDYQEARRPTGLYEGERLAQGGVLFGRLSGGCEQVVLGSRRVEAGDQKLRSLRGGFSPHTPSPQAVRGDEACIKESVGSPAFLRRVLCEESGEPFASPGRPGGDLEAAEGNRAPAEGAGRERQGDDQASGAALGGARPGLGGREDGEGGDGSRKWLADPLQAGSGERVDDDCHRGGWRVSHVAGSPGAGREEGCVLEVARVDRVPSEECGGGQTVFNLQVTGHPSYFAEGALVHNCHVFHQAHATLLKESVASGAVVIGLSATPWRKGLGKHFDEIVVGATTQQLTDLGFLCPATYYAPIPPDLAGVKTSNNGDWQEDALAEVMGEAELLGDIVQHWQQLAHDRQTIVFACNVGHSRSLCAAFKRIGVVADHIDGYMNDPEERRRIIDDYRAGKIQVLCNCQVLTKGFDAPQTGCLVIARPTKSMMLHIQMLGRGLRVHPGKTDCLLRGTTILTDKGEVRIEDVTLDHKVWDGVSFVEHSGAVCKGVRPVIKHDGLIATPDHRVMTHEGWKPLSEASDRQLEIVKTGLGGSPIRFPGDRIEKDRGIELWPSCGGGMPGVRREDNVSIPQHEEEEEPNRVLGVQASLTSKGSEVAVSALPGSAGQVQESSEPSLLSVWSSRHRVPFLGSERSRSVGGGESRNTGRQVSSAGSHQERWSLRGWESEVVDSGRKPEQHEEVGRLEEREVCAVQGGAPGGQVCGRDTVQADMGGAHGRPDSRAVEYPVVQAEGEVWDILNAGPLQRFTANGRLVHNCIVLDHAGNIRNGLPTDPVPTTLDQGDLGHQLDRKKQERDEPLPKACPACNYVSALHKCPACGFQPERRQDVAVKDGKLYPLDTTVKAPKWSTEGLAALYSEMLYYARMKGFRDGWAYHQCREFAGRAPNNTKQLKPQQPSERTLGIIQHMKIKKARARKKGEPV